jgi:hypothetical protein
MEDFPEDLQVVLLDTLYSISLVSIQVLAHVNRFWYRSCRKCAIKHHLDRPLMDYCIAAEGSLEVLKWAKSMGYYTHDFAVSDFAAMHGHIHILEWTRSIGYYWDSRISATAAQYGHVHVLEWIHLNSFPMCIFLCYYAASKGHLNVLKWTHSIHYVDANVYDVCKIAVVNKHLEVVKWIRSNGYSWNYKTEHRAKNQWPDIEWE